MSYNMYNFLWKILVAILPINPCINISVTGMQTYVALFQTDIIGSPSATSNVWIAYDKHIPSSKEFTICHWIKIKFYNIDNAACLWSYCTIQRKGDKMECLQACMKGVMHTAYRDLEFQGEIKLKKYDDLVSLRRKLKYYQHRTWNHLCWSFSSHTGKNRYYQNGEILSTDILNVTNDDLALKASYEVIDAALIVGQEPDSMRGGFNRREAYLGQLSEFNIWNYTLDDSDIVDMALCKKLQKGNIVAWEKSSWVLSNVVIEDIQDALFCIRQQQYLIVPEKSKFEEAQKICEIHGGSLAVPRSKEDSVTILDVVSNHRDKCIESTDSGKENVAWIGARKINRKWYEFHSTNSQGNLLNHTKVPVYRSTPYSYCSFLRNDGVWMEGTKSCLILSLCPVCKITGNPVFTVKGICNLADFDWNYYLSIDETNQLNFYEGYKSTNIVFNQQGKEWIFSAKPGHSIQLLGQFKVNNFTSSHPIGRKRWTIQGPACKTFKNGQILSISVCDMNTQFTCNSGHCINIDNRCDETRQCIDGSDELSCELVNIPPSYSVSNAPMPFDGHETLEVGTKIIVLSIDSIDSVDMIVTLTMKIDLQWYDSRLMFSSLMFNTDNRIPNKKSDLIWSPLQDMTYENAVIGEVTHDRHYVMNIIPTSPENSDPTDAMENRLFNGSSNPLRLTQRMKIKYGCTFDVTRFPFDSENCSLIMKIKQQRARRITFMGNGNVFYTGEAIIDQFEIGKMSSFVANVNDSTQLDIIIPMTRLPTNQFLNTFFPTVILWLFGYSTLFIEPTELGFTNRFMGAGTALLVIATLINAVKNDLPKTSYMKFIDIWFLWHVGSVFGIIIYHIVLDRIRSFLEDRTEPGNDVSRFEKDDGESLRKQGIKLIKNINKAMIYVFPILTGSFYIVYFCLKFL